MATNTKITLLALLPLLLAACSPLAPRPDPSQYFLLTPLPDTNATAPIANRQLAIGLGPIDFPDYLRRTEVVTRSAPNQVVISDRSRWAEPLDRNFERILSYNLATLLNTNRIEEYPWNHKTQIDYQVVINVQRFEMDANGQSQLVARWIVKDGRGNDLYASQTTASAAASSSATGPSAALSTDLGKLSSDIAARIVSLNTDRRDATFSKTAPVYIQPVTEVH